MLCVMAAARSVSPDYSARLQYVRIQGPVSTNKMVCTYPPWLQSPRSDPHQVMPLVACLRGLGSSLSFHAASASESDRNTGALLPLVSRRVSGIGRQVRLRRFTGLCDPSVAARLGTLRSLSDTASIEVGEGAGVRRFPECVESGQLCPRTRLRYIVFALVGSTSCLADARSHRRPCFPLPVRVMGAAFRLATPRR